MSESSILVVGVSSSFANKTLLRKKLERYTTGLPSFEVVVFNDLKGLVKDYFLGKEIRSLAVSSSLYEKRRLMRAARWAIFFWDGTGLADLIYLASLYETRLKVVAVETTRVVNRERGDEFDVYIGRGTPWGNPFPIGDGADRNAVVEMYREYFFEKFIRDPEGNKAIRSLKGKVLGCHCKPAPCHGDIIAEYLNSLDEVEPSVS